jgi:hypothetical protein
MAFLQTGLNSNRDVNNNPLSIEDYFAIKEELLFWLVSEFNLTQGQTKAPKCVIDPGGEKVWEYETSFIEGGHVNLLAEEDLGNSVAIFVDKIPCETGITDEQIDDLLHRFCTHLIADKVNHPVLFSVKNEGLSVIGKNGKHIGQSGNSKQTSNGCYIATAVYGSYDCPEVWVLRRYRDYSLKKKLSGRIFIKIYYSISPTLVRWFGNTGLFQSTIKRILDRWVERIRLSGFSDTQYSDK